MISFKYPVIIITVISSNYNYSNYKINEEIFTGKGADTCHFLKLQDIIKLGKFVTFVWLPAKGSPMGDSCDPINLQIAEVLCRSKFVPTPQGNLSLFRVFQ